MSERLIELVREVMSANHSGPRAETTERLISMFDPDFEFVSRVSAIEGGTYRGAEGARRYRGDMEAAFCEWTNEIEGIEVVAPDTAIVDMRFLATAHSGLPLEMRSAVVLIFAGEKLLRVLSYPNRAQALEAAGLAE